MKKIITDLIKESLCKIDKAAGTSINNIEVNLCKDKKAYRYQQQRVQSERQWSLFRLNLDSQEHLKYYSASNVAAKFYFLQ